MKLFPVLLEAGASGMGVGGVLGTTGIYIVFFGLMIYFMIYRPQKKQQKKQDELVNSIEIGDSILTTSGFYGVVIDISESDVIVEFGNNKNCRIPMQKSAITQVEKPSAE